jgi:hypothetical protein
MILLYPFGNNGFDCSGFDDQSFSDWPSSYNSSF